MPDPRVPASEPDQTIEDDEPDVQLEGRCEWCLAYLPSNGWCQCETARRDAEAEGAWLRYEEAKER